MQKVRWRRLTRLREQEVLPEYGLKFLGYKLAKSNYCYHHDIDKPVDARVYAASIEATYNILNNIKTIVNQYIDNAKVEGTIQTDPNSGLTVIDTDASGRYVKMQYKYGGVPNRSNSVGDSKLPEATIHVTHRNPPKSRIKRLWNRVKGVFNHG